MDPRVILLSEYSMDILKREMERKRREREELAAKANLTTTGARFLRQADVLAREEELQRERQRDLDEQRRRQCESEELREEGNEITQEGSVHREDKGEEKGNDLNDAQTELRSETSDASPSNMKRRRVNGEGSVKSDAEEKRSLDSQEIKEMSKLPEGYRFSADSSLTPESVIRKYLKTLIQQWEMDLELRDASVKNSAQGKVESRTLKQCKDYIKPLFKLCKRKEVPADIMLKLLAIVRNCEEGNFKYVF